MQVLSTPETLRAWSKRAKPGARATYHRGHLLREVGCSEKAMRDTVEDAARAFYDAGVVDLVQQRHGPNDYQYIAIKRRLRRRR